jgi:hypothetical protein
MTDPTRDSPPPPARSDRGGLPGRDALDRLEQLHASILKLRQERETTIARFRALTRAEPTGDAGARPGRAVHDVTTPPAQTALEPEKTVTPVARIVPRAAAPGFAEPALPRAVPPDQRAPAIVAAEGPLHELPAGLTALALSERLRDTESEIEPEPVVSGTAGARRWAAVGVLAGVAALVVAGAILLRPQPRLAPLESGGTQPSPAQGEPVGPAPASDVPRLAPKPAPSSARPGTASATGGVPGASALRVEIVTDRESWIRAVVDGRRAFERLVPSGASIPLTADEGIVVRIGDGGGVRLRVNGQDLGRAGRDGEVVTRRFVATPAKLTPPGSALRGTAGTIAAPVQVEIATFRSAWVRATADGERAFERLLAENQTVRLEAARSIVLLIGDAGAVRLRVNGEDRGRAGRDGEVVTQRFMASTMRAAAAPAVERAMPGTTRAGPVQLEIVTLRPAWIRATVDDARVFERLLPEGQRIPLEGARSIVLLIGDAGAVRLTLDGRDLGVPGRDGQVVSRRFLAGDTERGR